VREALQSRLLGAPNSAQIRARRLTKDKLGEPIARSNPGFLPRLSPRVQVDRPYPAPLDPSISARVWAGDNRYAHTSSIDRVLRICGVYIFRVMVIPDHD
jgi:hypothetical protein